MSGNDRTSVFLPTAIPLAVVLTIIAALISAVVFAIELRADIEAVRQTQTVFAEQLNRRMEHVEDTRFTDTDADLLAQAISAQIAAVEAKSEAAIDRSNAAQRTLCLNVGQAMRILQREGAGVHDFDNCIDL